MLVYQRVTIMKQPLSQPLAAQHQCLDLGLQGLGLLRYAMELLVAVPATGHPATQPPETRYFNGPSVESLWKT